MIDGFEIFQMNIQWKIQNFIRYFFDGLNIDLMKKAKFKALKTNFTAVC